jgi:plastocyanin
MKYTILLLLIILSATALAADFRVQVENIAPEFEGQQMPKPVAVLFDNQRINIHVDDVTVGIITENSLVTTVQTNELTKPTLNIYTTEATVTKILESKQPLVELQKALKNKDITYKAVGFFNKIKFSFTSIFARMFGGLGSQPDLPEEKEVKVEKKEPVKDIKVKEIEVKEEKKEEVKEDESLHIVEMTAKGFLPKTLKINVGDTVKWELARTNPNIGMVVGAQLCRDAKSKIFKNGETYEYTFTKPVKCTIVDGILTTQTMKLEVE